MSTFLTRTLAMKPGVTPYEIFDIPEHLLGERNTTPFEYLEARYEDELRIIVAAMLNAPVTDIGRVLGARVVAYLQQPGAWFYVARCCKRWHRVLIGDGLALPDIWILHYGLIADAASALGVGAEFNMHAAQMAARYVETVKPFALGSGDLVFPHGDK